MAVPINGKMLKAVRGQRRLSQQQLAERSGVSSATIKRIEASEDSHSSSSTTATRLSRALGVKLEDLSEDKFQQIINIGGDMELYLDRYTDLDELRSQNERLMQLVEARSRFLKR